MNTNMRDQERMMKKMRELALNNPERISIVETSVDPNIQIDFFEALQKLDNKLDKDHNVENYQKELFNPETQIERKKELLAILVGLGEVKSFRIIEKYLKKAEKELKTWTFLAYQQARLFLESKLLEESKIYIASGLGGKEHRLRYSFGIYTAKQKSFDGYQKKTIKGELEYFFKKEDCMLEEIKFSENYAVATCLVPVFLDLVDLLHQIFNEINQYGNFIHPNIFITNEKRIDIEEFKKLPESKNK